MRELKIRRWLPHDNLVLIVDLVSLTDKFTVSSLERLSDFLHHDVGFTWLTHNDHLIGLVCSLYDLLLRFLLISYLSFRLQSELVLLGLVGKMHMDLVHVRLCVANIMSRLLSCQGMHSYLLIGSWLIFD